MNIYVAHSRNFDFKKELYEPIRQSSLNNEHTFVLPHETSDEPFNSKDYLKNEADIIIAEVSEPATGLGIELGWADAYKVPILCIYKKGSKVSGSLQVVSQHFVEYSNSKELIWGIQQVIDELAKGRAMEKTLTTFGFIYMGIQYLHTVESILTETIKNENIWSIVSNKNISQHEYNERTKWSDFNTFPPTLFLFYHGIELILKGLAELQGASIEEKNHKISKLYKVIKDNKKNDILINRIKKYTEIKYMISPLKDFFESNNINIDKFYEAFRYPSSINGNTIYEFSKLTYTEEQGNGFSQEVVDDIDVIRKRIVEEYDRNRIKSNE